MLERTLEHGANRIVGIELGNFCRIDTPAIDADTQCTVVGPPPVRRSIALYPARVSVIRGDKDVPGCTEFCPHGEPTAQPNR